MDWSSVDFLSRLVDGGSGEFYLREIDESKSPRISVLSFDDSCPNDFSASLEEVL